MLVVIAILAVMLVGFVFFSRPLTAFSNPTHDIETGSGRTTLYHYRSRHSSSRGAFVLVHGFCENHMYFELLAERLNQAGYDCFAVNLFGYGGSLPNREDAYTIPAYSQQVKEALLEFKRLHMIRSLTGIVGHSMGAAAVFRAARDIVVQHGELQGIFLENPGFGENLSWLARVTRPFTMGANFRGPRHFLQLFMNLMFLPAMQDVRARTFIKKILSHHAPSKQVASTNARSNFEHHFDVSRLSEVVATKLHFIVSAKDKISSFERVQKNMLPPLQRQGFPQEQILILPAADHFVSLEDPKSLSEFILCRIEQAQSRPVSTSVK